MRILTIAVWAACLLRGVPAYTQSRVSLDHREAVYYADAYSDHYHVPRELVHAIITQESNWRADALSEKGALGIMQLMPATAARFGVRDPFSLANNIGGGVRYLAELMQEFKGELRLVVAAYYCGSRHVTDLSYSNSAVLSYVASVRRLYREEAAWHQNHAAANSHLGEQ